MDNHKGSYHITQGTLLHVMWQPRWEGSLGENGYKRVYGRGPLGSTWNYRNVDMIISYTPIQNKKLKIKRNQLTSGPSWIENKNTCCLFSSPCAVARPQEGLINIYWLKSFQEPGVVTHMAHNRGLDVIIRLPAAGQKLFFINFRPETFARKTVKLFIACHSFRLMERSWTVSTKATLLMQ